MVVVKKKPIDLIRGAEVRERQNVDGKALMDAEQDHVEINQNSPGGTIDQRIVDDGQVKVMEEILETRVV